MLCGLLPAQTHSVGMQTPGNWVVAVSEHDCMHLLWYHIWDEGISIMVRIKAQVALGFNA